MTANAAEALHTALIVLTGVLLLLAVAWAAERKEPPWKP